MTVPTATRPATWDLAPADPRTAVRGGLALTANEPARPATRLPAPIANRSTLKSFAFACSPVTCGLAGLARTVAEVCTTQRNATVTAVVASAPNW